MNVKPWMVLELNHCY